MAASDWTAVEAARTRLRSLDAEAAAGLAICTHSPLADQEEPAAFHHQQEARRGPSTGLCAVRTEAGEVLTSPEAVEREVSSYFEALFQGRHVPSANSSGFVDFGSSFHPDPDLVPALLDGLPSLSPDQRTELETPFTLGELQSAVEAAAASKAPGLDGLSYEFYKATFGMVGPPLLDGLNAMLNRGLLAPSLRLGVVRLLPKVPGVQLRPITLLNTDYKLLTKMFVACLLPLLPTVLQATQLCSIRGRSIHDGPASILSAAEFLHRNQLPGFLMSLDFFHAYDRVSMDWVDSVLKAMGFGQVFRGWIATLHREAAASFLLHEVSPVLAILFSIRQGDPLAALLFVIYLEPFLVRLEDVLSGLRVANIKEASFGYMDAVQVLGDDLQDIIRVDLACRDFEAASGALLNRNRKTTIIGLGSWAGCQDWPLQWILASTSVKVLGFTISPVFSTTVQLSWDSVLSGLERTLQSWRTRRLETLQQRVQVLETFVLSRAWYIAHLFPMPTSPALIGHTAPATRLRRLVADFLWAGRFRRLAFDECHAKRSAGGLGLSCPQTRAQAMMAKQTCRHLAAGGRPALHLAYWLGISLQGLLPALASTGLRLEGEPPGQYADLLTLLREVFALSCVDTANLQLATSAAIYKELTCTPPPPPWWSGSGGTCPGTTSGRGCRVHPWRLWRSTSTSPSCMASWTSWPTGTTGEWPLLLSARPASLRQPRRPSSIFSPAAPGLLQPGISSSSGPPSPLEWPSRTRLSSSWHGHHRRPGLMRPWCWPSPPSRAGPGPPDHLLRSWPPTFFKPGSLRPPGAAPSSPSSREDGRPRGLHSPFSNPASTLCSFSPYYILAFFTNVIFDLLLIN